jgi:acetyl esterase/lipase
VAATLGVLVAAVDYRRAPEHRYPVPLDDCFDAFMWLTERPYVDPARVAVAGASAGGGLAAGVALRARDREVRAPAFQLLSYPALDDRTAVRVDLDERNARVWDNRANLFAWRCYLGVEPGSPDVSPFAAPGRHPDLSGLPPAWIGVGTADLFHEEVVTYGQRLREAGVGCEIHVIDGAFHGFDAVCPDAPVSHEYRAAQLDALGRALNRSPSSEDR